MTIEQALPLLIPLAILDLALIATSLYDLSRPERHVKGGSKLAWGLVIVFVELFGPLVYFLFGREEV